MEFQYMFLSAHNMTKEERKQEEDKQVCKCFPFTWPSCSTSQKEIVVYFKSLYDYFERRFCKDTSANLKYHWTNWFDKWNSFSFHALKISKLGCRWKFLSVTQFAITSESSSKFDKCRWYIIQLKLNRKLVINFFLEPLLLLKLNE